MKLNFGQAFSALKEANCCMRLPKWSTDVVIKMQIPDENSKMSAPYLYVESRYGRVPWMPTVIELFSEDWEIRYILEPAKMSVTEVGK